MSKWTFTAEPHRDPPPTFEQAQNSRQKARAAGMDPNYWYPAEREDALAKNAPKEVFFWKRPIVLFKGENGRVRALAGRCLHRQLNLAHGEVIDNELVCPYHGWAYNGAGSVASLKGEQISKKPPGCRLHSYPVQIRYGIIWIFPGDPQLADSTPLPEIPELNAKKPWPYTLIDVSVAGHHSVVLENVSDFTHAYLHRRFKPFWNAKLTRLERVEDRVEVDYATKVGGGKYYQHLVSRGGRNTNAIELAYDYPYQRSNTANLIKHWLFVLPIDERTTRAFFIFYFRGVKLPGIPVEFPKFLMQPIVSAASRIVFRPLLEEDAFAVREEQEGYEQFYDAPPVELNPAVREFQKLTVDKWAQHLEQEAAQSMRKVS